MVAEFLVWEAKVMYKSLVSHLNALRLREQQKHALALAPEDRQPKVIKPVAQDSLSDPSAKHTLRQSDPEKCP